MTSSEPGEDAQVFDIGTAGTPGRGTGRRPSAAARSLAGRPRTGPAPRPVGAGPEVGAPEVAGSEVGPEADQIDQTHRALQADQTHQIHQIHQGPGVGQPAADPGGSTYGSEPASEQSNPLAGIPAAQWWHALTSAAQEVFGEDWEPQLARFLAFLRRRVSGDFGVDAFGFDEEITRTFLLAVLRPIASNWFRIEVTGAENIPATGGALVVSNHSGTLPLDALMTLLQVHDHTGRYLRPLGADLVFRLPFVSSLARKAGATLACTEDAERMLRSGELVGVWPEGFKGIGKPFSERYKLQRFGRGGFVAAALRTEVPIIPVSVVGAEEIYPLVGNIPGLARILGLPYLPITPFFPLLGPLGAIPLPSKWLIEFGEPIRTDTYEAGAADDPMLVFNVTDQVRETIQQTLFTLLQRRGGVFG